MGEKVNPKGGAIALGHPLGCTGSRQIATLMPELKRHNKKLGVVSMCIGTGMGAAGVIESEQCSTQFKSLWAARRASISSESPCVSSRGSQVLVQERVHQAF